MSANMTAQRRFNALIRGSVAHEIGGAIVYLRPEGDGVRLLVPRGYKLVHTQHCATEALALAIARVKIAELRARVV